MSACTALSRRNHSYWATIAAREDSFLMCGHSFLLTLLAGASGRSMSCNVSDNVRPLWGTNEELYVEANFLWSRDLNSRP